MTIDSEHDEFEDRRKYTLSCDGCSHVEEDDEWEVFNDVTKWARENGWKTKKEGDQWTNLCPTCKEIDRV